MKFSVRLILASLILYLVPGFPQAQAADNIRIQSVRVSGNSVTLNSTKSTTIKNAKYNFEFVDAKSPKKVYKSVKISTPTLVVGNFSWFSNYLVRVRLVVGNTYYKFSSYYNFKTTGPELDSPSFTNVTQTKAMVNWNEDPIYDSYVVIVNDARYVAKNAGFTISNLAPSTSYSVSVQGTSNGVLGSTSIAEKLVTSNDGPSDLLATATSSALNLSWTPIEGASSYKIFKDGVFFNSATSSKFTIPDLNPGTWYAIGVSAVIGTHETAQSINKFNTLQIKAAKPTISGINSTFATVSWAPVVGVTKYEISLYDQTGLTPIVIGKNSGKYLVAAGINSITISGLTSAQIYTVTLKYIYDGSESLVSDFATFTSVKPLIGTVTLLSTTSTTASISWPAAEGATLYEIFKDNVYLTTTEKSVTTYQFTGLTAGTTFKLGVKARYLDSNSLIQTSDQSSINVTTLVDANSAPAISTYPVINLPSGTTPIINMVLTSTYGIWSSSTTISSYTYQWQRSSDASSFSNIDGATSSTYTVTAIDLAHYLRVKVTATNPNGTTNVNSSYTNQVIANGNLILPIVSGKPVVGEVLDTSDGTWNTSGTPSFTYQWYDATSGIISGATSSKYTVTDSEAGHRIYVVVTATTKNGSTAATSASTAIAYTTGNTVLPVVTGTARVGSILSTTTGTWLNSPTISYIWQRSSDGISWSSISGATNSTYTITNDDAGNYLRAQVVGSKATGGGTTYKVAVESAATAAVPSLLISNSVRPVLSGSWTQGQTLSTTNGTWSSSGTFTYQWQRSTDNSTWSDISSATSSSYVLTSSDASKYIRVQVTNTSSTSSGLAYSNSTVKVDAPYNTVLPTISGTVQVAQTQTVTNGTWSNTPTAYAYQWQSSSDGIAWSDISGATTNTYAPTFSVANLQLRVQVSAGNAVDTATVTTAILSGFLPPAATAVPTISGTVQVGQTLTSNGGTWPGTSNSYRVYLWQRSSDNGITWTSIAGATASTYVLVAADTGYLIRSQVSLTTNAGTATAYSLPTIAVAP